MFCHFFLSVSLCCLLISQPATKGDRVVFQMYQRYAGKWYSRFSFDQRTMRYDKDSVHESIWHEYTEFPDKFRIDFGNPDQRNTAIFTHDSVFRFKNGSLVYKRKDENELTFLLGGLYFMPYDSVRLKMKRIGYDLSKSCELSFNSRPVFIVGANSPSEKTNQFWVDKKELYVVKNITYNRGQKEELRFFDHARLKKGWTETRVEYLSNDTLAQKETYFNCKENPKFPADIFEPNSLSIKR